jgi:predicted O-methyltransferase YrrM
MNENLRNRLYQLLMVTRSYSVDRFRYHYCRWTGRPYFGAYMAALQGWPERYAAMETLIRSELRNHRGESYQVLEVGSWAGGSALIWGKALKSDNRKGNRLVCIDPWEFYPMESDLGLGEKLMSTGFKNDGIYRLFRHNTACGGIRDLLIEIRGASADVLPMLTPNRFHLAYVDGNHGYRFVKADLGAAGPLVAEGGILCGDDLELQMGEFDEAIARTAGDKDFIRDPKLNKWYHPGVALGVGEFFGKRVSEKCGFWAMRKAGDQWIEVPQGK